MPRWTQNIRDIRQIARINTMITEERLMFGPLRIGLQNGTVIVGHAFGANLGNNANQVIARRADWAYYGALKVATETGNIEVDYLDIATIEPN